MLRVTLGSSADRSSIRGFFVFRRFRSLLLVTRRYLILTGGSFLAMTIPCFRYPGSILSSPQTPNHIEHRAAYFRNAQKYLRPGGRVAIIEFNGKGWFERILGHWVEREVIVAEMQEAGYRLSGDFDFLDRQHLLVFHREN